MSGSTTPSAIVAELADLYAGPLAHRLYDEVITELEHALQAALLADSDGAEDELVAAALLHDVGHLILDDNVTLDDELTEDFGHDGAGARHLARHFPAAVSAPVALHVTAKRYLCATEPGYEESLSASSTRSLGVQGGPMDDDEVAAFERRPGWEAAVAVRRWDDLAKVADLQVPGFDTYLPLLERLAR